MITNTKELKNNIKILNKAVSKNTDVRIAIKNNALKVIIPEVSFTQYINSTDNIEDITVELKLIDFKKAVETVKTKDMNIVVYDTYLLIENIKLKVYKIDIEGCIKKESMKLNIPSDYFVAALSKCIFYTDEAYKPVLTGILFDFQKDKLILASTNSKVLNKEVITIDSGIEKKIIIQPDSIKSLLELKKQTKELKGSLNISIYDTYIEFNYNNGVYIYLHQT